MIPTKLAFTIEDNDYDVIVAINDTISGFSVDARIENALNLYKKTHPKIESCTSIVPINLINTKTLIYVPISSLHDDYDDSRRVYDSANDGIRKAVELGFKKPMLVCGDLKTLPNSVEWAKRENVNLTAMLGGLFGGYVPIEIREDVPERAKKIEYLGYLKSGEVEESIASSFEEGRRVARDIGGSDPERMAAPRIAEYIQKEFAGSCVSVSVENVSKDKYPLMEAVNRAASVVNRHNGRVVKFEYQESPNEEVEETLFLVGKGITYDTGGTDIKAGGVMAGMHRDKCGAAAVTGFFKALSLLKPKKLRVVGLCAYVRNSVGQESYVADEIITSRAKRRVRVGNTDAEGRMVMADLLCEAKEMAVNAVNPSLFTVATLTGHVVRAYGTKYTAVLGNGPSCDRNIPQCLQKAGDLLAEPVEISTIRREDVAFHRGFNEYDDVLQCNNQPSSATARGHQTPAGFLILASGLDNHSRASAKPLPYTHVDCAGSAGGIGALPTAAPLLMFAARYILPKLR